MADLPKLAHVGDSIECDVRHPYPRTIRMTLETPAAAAHANDLLMAPASGWRLVSPSGVMASAQGQCLRDGVAESVLDTRNGNADWTKAGTGVNSPTSPGLISRKAYTGSVGSNPTAVAPPTVDWLGLALDLEAQAKRVESQTVERAMLAAAHGLRLMGASGVKGLGDAQR